MNVKINALLSILVFATPALAASARKRVFKVYTSEQLQRKEGKRKLQPLKGAGQNAVSMSMSTNMQLKQPKQLIAKKTKEPKEPKQAMSMDMTGSPTTATESFDTTAPPIPTRVPIVAETMTAPPTPSPMRIMAPTDASTLSPVAAVTPSPTPLPSSSPTIPATDKAETEPPTAATVVTASPIKASTSEEEENIEPDLPAAGATAAGATAAEASSGAVALGTTLSVMVVACAVIFV